MNPRVSFLLAASFLVPPVLAAPFTPAARAAPSALPAGFHLAQPITGRIMPTSTAFAHDGREFVIEKSGLVWVYRNLLDTQRFREMLIHKAEGGSDGRLMRVRGGDGRNRSGRGITGCAANR